LHEQEKTLSEYWAFAPALRAYSDGLRECSYVFALAIPMQLIEAGCADVSARPLAPKLSEGLVGVTQPHRG